MTTEPLPLFTAVFTVEAATLEDAEAAIGAWTVGPGTILQSISGMVVSDSTPIVLSEGGQVATEGTKLEMEFPPAAEIPGSPPQAQEPHEPPPDLPAP